jgi:hypothetical protein
MLKGYFREACRANRNFILEQVLEVKGLMQLLMKERNGQQWNAGEKQEIVRHLRHLSRLVPVLSLFLLPGGSLLLPMLACLLDRRKRRRLSGEKQAEISPHPDGVVRDAQPAADRIP